MWSDIAKVGNNFIDDILWGAKWTNLPNNRLAYTINYGTNSPNYENISVLFYLRQKQLDDLQYLQEH